jgi:hypothetical protein
MSNSVSFVKGMINESILNLHTAMPCKVLSYNESSMRAKIQPLFMMKEVGESPEPLAPIEDVPVLFQRYKVDGITKTYTPVLNSGDVVLAVFCQRAMDDVLSGKVAYPSINRNHDIQDAVIVGVIG